MYWITPDGSYYEGLHVAEGSVAVTQRPSTRHKWEGGAWVVDAEVVKAEGRALIDKLERERQLPKAVRTTIMQLAEKEAIAAGAARTPALTAEQSLTLLRSNAGTTYNQVRLFHNELDVIRVEHGL
jgi:hypothetical protein